MHWQICLYTLVLIATSVLENMLQIQVRVTVNVSFILFPSSQLQKVLNYSLQNNHVCVWLRAEVWQDCSILVSPCPTWWLAVTEQIHHPSISGGWIWATQDHKEDVVSDSRRSVTMQGTEVLICWPDLSSREVCYLLGTCFQDFVERQQRPNPAYQSLLLSHRGTNDTDRGDLDHQVCLQGCGSSIQQHGTPDSVWLDPASEEEGH